MAENAAGSFNPDELRESIFSELEQLRDAAGRLINTPETQETLGEFIHESLTPPEAYDLNWSW